jgi:hypothetical protein
MRSNVLLISDIGVDDRVFNGSPLVFLGQICFLNNDRHLSEQTVKTLCVFLIRAAQMSATSGNATIFLLLHKLSELSITSEYLGCL